MWRYVSTVKTSSVFVFHSPSALKDTGHKFERRGELEVKGKGAMVTYFLIG